MEKEKEQLKPQVRDMRNGDWYWVNKLILDHPYLSTSAKLVYHALTYFANESQKAYPSFEKIAELTNLKRITVIKAIKQLERYHFIRIERTQGKVNHYTLLKLTDSKVVKKIYPYKKGTGGVSNRHQGGYQIGTTNNTNLTKPNIKKEKEIFMPGIGRIKNL